MKDTLVLHYSCDSVHVLAERIACDIESVSGPRARLRRAPHSSTVCEVSAADALEAGAPYVEPADRKECAGLALGSPVRFGNMAAPIKYFRDDTLVGKHPTGVVQKPGRT